MKTILTSAKLGADLLNKAVLMDCVYHKDKSKYI